MATQIRKIVKDAFNVDELIHQFTVIDVEDGYLQDATEAEVSEKYSDKYIVGEAEHRLDIVTSNLEHDGWEDEQLCSDYNQLTKFIRKYS